MVISNQQVFTCILQTRGLAVAYGHAVPIHPFIVNISQNDPSIHGNAVFIDPLGIDVFQNELIKDRVAGISVPISRGSPPLLISR